MSKALLVIDVQNYFAIERAENIPVKIAGHIRDSAYDHVLFTKFRNDPESNFHKILEFTEVMESPMTDIHPVLVEFTSPERVFEKTTYSALKSSALQKYLADNAVHELHLCGINLDACVLATAYEAFDSGFDVTVLEGLCSVASVRSDYEDAAKTILKRNLTRGRIRTKRPQY